MTARLFSKTGDTRGSELELDGEAIIGRDRKSDLVIDRPLMSGRHARVFFDEGAGRYVLEDLGSLNGTELDGDRITGPERLGHLHVITFAGSYDFFFQDLERCARRHPGARPAPPVAAEAADRREVTAIERKPVALPGSLARRADEAALPAEDETPAEGTVREKLPVALPGFLARRADAAADDAAPATVDMADIEDLITADDLAAAREPSPETPGLQLVVTEPGGGSLHCPLAEGENLVGRGGGAQVILPYPDLSRRHAALVVAGGEVRIRDLGSRNQTFVDDEPLAPRTDVAVEPGARLRFGSVEARLVTAGLVKREGDAS